jgi:hypothetical protein
VYATRMERREGCNRWECRASAIVLDAIERLQATRETNMINNIIFRAHYVLPSLFRSVVATTLSS